MTSFLVLCITVLAMQFSQLVTLGCDLITGLGVPFNIRCWDAAHMTKTLSFGCLNLWQMDLCTEGIWITWLSRESFVFPEGVLIYLYLYNDFWKSLKKFGNEEVYLNKRMLLLKCVSKYKCLGCVYWHCWNPKQCSAVWLHKEADTAIALVSLDKQLCWEQSKLLIGPMIPSVLCTRGRTHCLQHCVWFSVLTVFWQRFCSAPGDTLSSCLLTVFQESSISIKHRFLLLQS